MFGAIDIGSRVIIGANAVVRKPFPDDVTIAGVPAKVVAEQGTADVDISANPVNAQCFFEQHPQYKSYQED